MRGTEHVSTTIRFRVHEGLGDVLVLRARYGEANEQFEAAHLLAQGDLVLAGIDWKLGVATFKKGDMGDARDYLEKSIKALGERPPTEQAGDIWEANMARMIMTVPMYHAGDLKGAYREAKNAYEIGIETGDYSAACISLLFWIPAAPHTIPPGLREAGIVAAMEGKEDVARRFFDESLQVATNHEAPYDHARTSLARGEAGLQFGWPGAQKQIAEAKRLLDELENLEAD